MFPAVRIVCGWLIRGQRRRRIITVYCLIRAEIVCPPEMFALCHCYDPVIPLIGMLSLHSEDSQELHHNADRYFSHKFQ
jgi:hypothetical protein